MKTKLLSTLVLLLISSLSFADKLTPEQRVELLKKKKVLTLEDFEHEISGCPENSECNEEMGKQRGKWLALIKKLGVPKTKEVEIQKQIEEFRKVGGLPVEFYTNSQAQKRFSPIVFESPCALHNPKKKEDKILLGEAFFKDTKNNTAHLQVGNTAHDIPLSDLIYLDPVYVYDVKDVKSAKVFYVPKGEKPVYISADTVTLLREENGVYYGLNINTKGEWTVSKVLTHKEIKRDEYNSDSACVKNEEAEKYFGKDIYKKYYQDNFCQTIFDVKASKELQMRLPWSC